MFDTHELGRRPGAMQRLTRTVEAPGAAGTAAGAGAPQPEEFGIKEVVGVPAGRPVALDLRLESVMEGVLVTGTARTEAEGECVRCLEPLGFTLEADFQEMFSYPETDERGRAVPARTGESEGDEEDEDRLFVEDGLFDLEPVLRDAVVLALPMQPVCREDCPGLCSACGVRLADHPDHHHEAADIRWAALQGLAETIQDGEKDVPRDGGDDTQET